MESNKTIRIFDGATAIVTGGASGIGRALVEELARRGCEVVLGDLQIEQAEEVVTRIKAAGGKAMAAKIDVRDFPAMEQVVSDTVKRFGRLDYIFNNAGIGIGGGVIQYSIEDWNYIVDVNLRGVINGVQAAYPIMIKQGFGHIINTASMAGLIPSPGNVAYATTKHAIVGLSISLRAEAALLGVRVSVLCPGVISTPIWEGGGKYGKTYSIIPPELVKQILEKARPMPPDIFAKKALNLVAKNRAIIIVPSWWRWLWRTNRLSPSVGIFRAEKLFQNMLRKLGLLQKG
jgi:NAD(P)-dependent dehydrogenase (short-subunit alcohol dehydrogenase family)